MGIVVGAGVGCGAARDGRGRSMDGRTDDLDSWTAERQATLTALISSIGTCPCVATGLTKIGINHTCRVKNYA